MLGTAPLAMAFVPSKLLSSHGLHHCRAVTCSYPPSSRRLQASDAAAPRPRPRMDWRSERVGAPASPPNAPVPATLADVTEASLLEAARRDPLDGRGWIRLAKTACGSHEGESWSAMRTRRQVSVETMRRALQYLREGLKHNPRNEHLWYALVMCVQAICGPTETAAVDKVFQHALTQVPDAARLYIAYAKHLMGTRREHAQAIELLEGARRRGALSSELVALQATAHRQLFQPEQALLALFSAILPMPGDHAMPQSVRAYETLILQGQFSAPKELSHSGYLWRAAAALYDSMDADDNDDTDGDSAADGLSPAEDQAAISLRKMRVAAALWRRVCMLEPVHSQAWVRWAELEQALVNRGGAVDGDADPTVGIRILRRGMAATEGQLMPIRLALANAELRRGACEAARATLLEALGHDNGEASDGKRTAVPETPLKVADRLHLADLYRLLGTIELRMKQRDVARSHFHEALAVVSTIPGDTKAMAAVRARRRRALLRVWALTEWDTGDIDFALNGVLNEVNVSSVPYNGELWRLAGELETERGNLQRARQCFSQALAQLGDADGKNAAQPLGSSRRSLITQVTQDLDAARLWLAWGRCESRRARGQGLLDTPTEVPEENAQLAAEYLERAVGIAERRCSAADVAAWMPAQYSARYRPLRMLRRVGSRALIERAALSLHLGRFEEQREQLRKALQLDPYDSEAWRDLADAEMRRARSQQRKRDATGAAAALEALRSFYRSATRWTEGDADENHDDDDEEEEEEPESIDKVQLTVHDGAVAVVAPRSIQPILLCHWAQVERSHGDRERARELARRVCTRIAPDYLKAWMMWALCEKDRGAYEQARQVYREGAARARSERLQATALFIAWSKFEEERIGDAAAAIKVLEQALAHMPDSTELQRALAAVLERHGYVEQAYTVLQTLLQQQESQQRAGSPPGARDKVGDAAAWQQLAMLEARVHHNYDRACACLQEAIAIDPRNASLYTSLGVLEQTYRRSTGVARELFQRALTYDRTFAPALLAWARLEAQQGDVRHAEQLLLQIVRANAEAPGTPGVPSPASSSLAGHRVPLLVDERRRDAAMALRELAQLYDSDARDSSVAKRRQYLLQAVEANPWDAETYAALATLAMQSTEGDGDGMEAAREWYRRGLERCPHSGTLLRAWVTEERQWQLAGGRSCAALQAALEQARAACPRDVDVAIACAEWMGDASCFETALSQVAEGDVRADIYLAWAQQVERQGGGENGEGSAWQQQARSLLRKAVAEQPRSRAAWHASIALEQRIGDAARVRELQCQAAAVLHPGTEVGQTER
ncbi:hypothetical protein CDCA_CDCA01G0373 [Cyanidium caldarium]|uniref:PsbB mRNA maturation factor Mbb1 n=1 Tax=Cyanidium caldarium TaxID=2771 RepID=A0AAV9IR03_CYACA|nr:hypothetical protein CDCA_CDCA01G0373 [Cyanidium caldarium]